jgi:hypothetical protein
MDLPGIGSMGPGYLKGDSYIGNTSYNQWFGAVLTKKSFVALRAEDIIRAVRFIRKDMKNTSDIQVVSIGPLGSEVLHAAIFEKQIRNVALVQPFLSYADIAMTRFYDPSFIPFTVAGAIEAYDLPDLMAYHRSGKLLVIDPVAADGSAAAGKQRERTYAFPDKVLNASKRESFKVDTFISPPGVAERIMEWLR